MNKLYSVLFYCFISISFIRPMEHDLSDLLKKIPEEVGQHIVCCQLQDIHNQVNTVGEARDCLVSVSLVNKHCNGIANDPHIIKNMISNLTVMFEKQLGYFEDGIAGLLTTPATKKYLAINNQFFSDHIKKEDVLNLLSQGADPNFRRSFCAPHYRTAMQYHESRHKHSSMPLIFFSGGMTDQDLEIAQCLLENGADINKKVLGYHCSFDVAMNNNNTAMIQLLLIYKPDFIDALHTAVVKNDVSVIQELFNREVQPAQFLKNIVTQALCGNLPMLVLKIFCDHIVQDASVLDELIEDVSLRGQEQALSSIKSYCRLGESSTVTQELQKLQVAKERVNEVIAILRTTKEKYK